MSRFLDGDASSERDAGLIVAIDFAIKRAPEFNWCNRFQECYRKTVREPDIFIRNFRDKVDV